MVAVKVVLSPSVVGASWLTTKSTIGASCTTTIVELMTLPAVAVTMAVPGICAVSVVVTIPLAFVVALITSRVPNVVVKSTFWFPMTVPASLSTVAVIVLVLPSAKIVLGSASNRIRAGVSESKRKVVASAFVLVGSRFPALSSLNVKKL